MIVDKMTIDNLRAHLEVDDLVFYYKDKTYFICPFKEFYSAGEADQDDIKYKTFDELINNFMVQGKPLKEIVEDIDW